MKTKSSPPSRRAATVFSSPSRFDSVWTALESPRPTKRSSIFPMPWTARPRPRQAVEDRRAGGRNGVVASAVRPREAPRRADERPRDDAPDAVRRDEELPGDLAPAVERRDRNDLLVRGDLEDRVPRGVDDGPAGAEVLLSVLPDHLRAGGGPVVEDLLPDRLLERLDDLGRKAVGIERECRVERQPHQLPVTRRRVLPRRGLGAASEGPRRSRKAGGSVGVERVQEAEARKVRQRRPPVAQDVLEGTRPFVPVRAGVGRRAHAQPVTDDHDGPRLHPPV